MENLSRFFLLQERVGAMPFPLLMKLRAIYIVRNQYGQNTHELVIFADCVRIWAKTRVSPSERAYAIANELMGEILDEAAVYGLRTNLDFTIKLGQERPEIAVGKKHPLGKEPLPGELLPWLPNTLD